VSDSYSIARTILEAAEVALTDTYAGTPERRFVSVGIPVHDTPDQLTVHLPSIGPNAASLQDHILIVDLTFIVTITRPYPGQPGDGGVVPAEHLDEAAKIIYEDFDALLKHFTCNTVLGAEIQSVTQIEPLGGVSGWTMTLVVSATT
jgi:hypothetical protein